MSDYVSLPNKGWRVCLCRCTCGHAAGSHIERRHGIRECRYCDCNEHVGCDITKNTCQHRGWYSHPQSIKWQPRPPDSLS